MHDRSEGNRGSFVPYIVPLFIVGTVVTVIGPSAAILILVGSGILMLDWLRVLFFVPAHTPRQFVALYECAFAVILASGACSGWILYSLIHLQKGE